MKNKTYRIVESAIMIALSFVLDYVSNLIPFTQLPLGGKFTIFSMLPIIYLGCKYGIGQGLVSGLIISLFQLISGFAKNGAALMLDKWYLSLIMLFIDYICAYTVLGFAGVTSEDKNITRRLIVGSLIGTTLRYFCHIISGAIYIGSYAEFLFTEGSLAGTAFAKMIINNFSGGFLSIIYSAVYNGLYMIPEIIITLIGAFAISKIGYIRKSISNR
ncbi:MAG: energy-coupled thiamine transporter ThiT [Firmicutes bacterium]|nr:energy-coupled thiamine transporter ThiT [Candidatus Colimorpha enterica]